MAEAAQNIQTLLKQKKHPLIFICGLPAAGKTTFSQKLKVQFPDAVVVQGDWFIKHPTEQRLERIIYAETSGESEKIKQETNPVNWFDWPQFEAALVTLQKEGTVKIQHGWNQSTGEKNLDIELALPKNPAPIICECAYLLHLESAQNADFKILIDTPIEIAAQRLRNREENKFSDTFMNHKNFLAYREQLTEKYDMPYFKKYRNSVDMIIADQDTLD